MQESNTLPLEELRLLRRPDVEMMCGISRSLLYAMIARGEFPPPVRIHQRAVGWRASDVRMWLQSRHVAPDTGSR